MADKTASFSVKLEDDASGAAESAAGALEKLRGSVQADTAELRAMQAAMKQLQGGTNVSIAAFKDLQAQIDAKKASIAEAQAAYVSLGGTFAKPVKASGFGELKKEVAEVRAEMTKTAAAAKEIKAPKAAEAAAAPVKLPVIESKGEGLKELAESAKQAGGPVGSVVGKVQNLVKSLGPLGAAGVVAAAGILILVAALVAGAVALAQFALGAADAARSDFLKLQGAMKGDAAAAKELQGAIDAVASSSALSREQIGGYATQLSKAGLKGAELQRALEAMAIAGSAGGEEVAAAFLKDVAAAKAAGQSVDALAAKMKAELGGVAAAQALALSVQLTKAKDNASKLFSGVNIEAFLKGLDSVLKLLDSSTASGRALKAIMEGLLNPLFADLAKAAPYAKAFFQGMVIGALTAYVVILKLQSAFKGLSGAKSGIDWIKVAVYAGIGALGALLAILGAIAAIALVLAVLLAIPFIIAALPILLLVAIIYSVVDAAEGIIDAFGAAADYLGGIDWGGIGSALIDGLVGGILSGGSALISAVSGLASSATGALKSALGISSPSKVFAKLGVHTSAGFAEGVDQGSAQVDKAVGDMVSTPEASPKAAGAGGGKGGVTVNLTINGVKGAEELKDDGFWTKVAMVLEDALEQGGGPLPEGA